MISNIYNLFDNIGWIDTDNYPLEKILKKDMFFRRSYYLLLQPLSLFSSEGFNFMEEKWDYAIVLDSCRYDSFARINNIPGSLQKKQSLGSATMEWVKKAITKDYKDTIVITANPFLSKLKLKEITGEKNRFLKNIPAWDIGYNMELGVTPPWTMLEICKKRINKYKNYKILFWFNQPHGPYLTYAEEKKKYIRRFDAGWTIVSNGEIPMDEFKRAYEKNLKIVLKYVSELIELLDGKIIITADHGECFGEFGIISHPQRIHIPPLIEVPYFEVEK